jgi:hypothetical protein
MVTFKQMNNELYLNQVRNAFILLVIGFTIFTFESDWSIFSLLIIGIGIFFILNVVLHYYLIGERNSVMDLTSLGLLVLIGVFIWLLLRAYFESDGDNS